MAAGEEGVQQIERDGAMPHRQIHLVHRMIVLGRSAGAIEQHVEAAEALDGRFDRASHGRILRHVGLDEQRLATRLANLALGTLAGFAVDLGQHHFRAFLDEHFGGRLGDAGACTGQERHLSFELPHRFSLHVLRGTTCRRPGLCPSFGEPRPAPYSIERLEEDEPVLLRPMSAV